MNPLFAAVVGGGVYLLARGTQPSAADKPNTAPADAPQAVLSGNDGAQPAGDGRALSAFPAVGDTTTGGTVQTAPAPVRRPGGAMAAPATGLAPRNPPASKPHRPNTQVLVSKHPLKRDHRTGCNTCGQTQSAVKAAVRSVSPGLVF